MKLKLILVLLAATVISVVGHSWLDCSNWKFNNAAAYSDPTLRRFSNSDGVCEGWARRFLIGQRPFGGDDAVQFFRHYVQPPGTAMSCRYTDGSTGSSGSNESPGFPRSLAYTPNKDPYGQYTFGRMAQVTVGQTICWRWPAKNHQAHVDVATNMVFVNWDDVPNRPAGTELNLAQLRTKRIAQMPFANCPVPGVPSAGDSAFVGSDFAPCGGCFTVPNRAVGIYTVQWDWPFKVADTETYTSCADIQIVAGGTSTGGGSTTVTPPVVGTNTNCVVTAWSAFGACSGNCGTGTQIRTRTVTTAQSGTGTACPATSESQLCNTQPCVADLSAHVVYDDVLHDFQSWSWATSYSLAATAFTIGSKSISFVPKNWEAIFLHYNLPASFVDYRAISFYIHGGTTGGQQLRLVISRTGTTSVPVLTWTIPRTSIKANAWTKVSLTFANLGLTTGSFDGIWFQATTTATQGTVYIDEIYFTHIHSLTARLESEATDPCTNIACGSGAKCVAGSCTCKALGYFMDSDGACTIAPSISNVVLKSADGLIVESLDVPVNVSAMSPLYQLTWDSYGSIDTVSIVLEEADSPSMTPFAIRIINSNSFVWELPLDIEPGTYYLRVSYSATIYARSQALEKTTDAEYSPCIYPYCSGHGDCDSDSSYTCSCNYGWTGALCGIEPTGVTHLQGSIIVRNASASYNADPNTFLWLFRADISSALGLVLDQVQVMSVKITEIDALVTFEVLLGSMFSDSPFVNTETSLASSITTQFDESSSSLNRGVQTYADPEATDSSAASSLTHHYQASYFFTIIATILGLIVSSRIN